MFDANMRHIPQGVEFFAQILNVRENHPLSEYFEESDTIRCKMLVANPDNPLVRFFLKDGWIDFTNFDSGYYSLIVYVGKVDGTDFINEEIKQKTMSLFGE